MMRQNEKDEEDDEMNALDAKRPQVKTTNGWRTRDQPTKTTKSRNALDYGSEEAKQLAPIRRVMICRF